MMKKKNILGVGITDATKKETLEYIVNNVENFQKKLYVVTPNPEFLVLANKNTTFKSILNKADLALVDGIGIMIAGKVMGKPLKERFTGVDLVKSLCEAVAEKPITVGFLGGRDNVAEKTAECLIKKYPGLRVVFAASEWENGVNARQPRVSDDVRRSFRGPAASFPPVSARSISSVSSAGLLRAVGSPSSDVTPQIDILFVAFGAPKQELWISENLNKIPVKVAIGAGGAFDYISEKTPRAPSFIRDIGLEWLFRLIVQPWRIKRQLALIEFVWLVIKEKLSNKN